MRPVYQIFVEEQLLDIDPKTTVSITLQASDFASGDISSRKASFTNQLRIPATQNNIRIFEFANNPKSRSQFPFNIKRVSLLCNGIRILEGVTTIQTFDNFFNIQIYSIVKDLFYNIANLYLSDIDFGDSPITWNQSFMDSKRASTSGWCSPVIDYGQIVQTYPTVADASIGDYNLPSISYKDILTKIITNAGYTVSGDLYDNDTTFNNMVMTYGRDTWYGATMTMDQALPTDVLQSDFLKDFLVKFGCFFRINDFNCEIVKLETSLNDISNSIDWTNKRVRNKKDIVAYNWGSSYAQINNFEYSADSSHDPPTGFIPVENKNGNLPIANANLKDNRIAYTSIFDAPDWNNNGAGYLHNTVFKEAGLVKTILCFTSPVYTSIPSSFVFDNTPKPRLALLRAKDASEDGILYNGSLRTDYKVGHFSDNFNNSWSNDKLSWRGLYHNDGLLDVYYKSFQSLIANGNIAVTHEYYLTDMDINSLDLHTLVFDDGNYYLINKVPSYISGRTTRVELLQISN